MNNNDEFVDVNAKIRMKKSAIDGLNTGKLRSNNGIRNSEGHLDSFVDVVEINDTEENVREYYISQLEELEEQEVLAKEQEDGDREEAIELLGKATAGLIAILIFLSQKENRETIKNAWNGIVVPKVKGVADRIHNIKWFQSKQKVETGLVASCKHSVKETEQQKKNERIKETISKEEFRQKIENVRNLAIILAAEIEDISKFEPSEDITQEELFEHQETIRRLTTKETLSFIEYLISNNEVLNLEMTTVANFKEFVSEHNKQLEIIDETR